MLMDGANKLNPWLVPEEYVFSFLSVVDSFEEFPLRSSNIFDGIEF